MSYNHDHAVTSKPICVAVERAIDAANNLMSAVPSLYVGLEDLQSSGQEVAFRETRSDIGALTSLLSVIMHELGEIRDRNCVG